MASSSADISLEDILRVNKTRKNLLDNLSSLESKLSKETVKSKRTLLLKSIDSTKTEIERYEKEEIELLKQAQSHIISAYQDTLSSDNPKSVDLASQVEITESKHSGDTIDITSSDDSGDSDKTELAVQTSEGIDTSPNTGFEKFGIKTKNPDIPNIVVSDPETEKTKKSKKTKHTKSRRSSKVPDSESDTAPTSDNKSSTDTKTTPIGKTKDTSTKTTSTTTSTSSTTTSTSTYTPPHKKMATSVVYTPPKFQSVYDGSTNIDRFFNKYEAYAGTFGWNDDMKLSQLQFHLEKAAYKCYENLKKTLTAKSTFTYDTVKAQMKKYFASKSSSQEYEKLLRERKLMFNEPIEEYFWDVVELVYKIDKGAKFEKILENVLKGLPQEIAKDIWKAKPTDIDKLQDLILDHQKFESLIGKKVYGDNEQAINEIVNQLKGLGFKVQKQEINYTGNKKKNKSRKGKKSNSHEANPSGPQSLHKSQSHPRPFFQNNRRGRWNPNNRQVRFQNQNPWNTNGRRYDYENSRRDQQYQQNPTRGFIRQGPPRYNNNRRYQGTRGNFINYYDHYDNAYPPEEMTYVVPSQHRPQILPYNQQTVNSYYQGND